MFRKQYEAFMRQYEEFGHMEKLEASEIHSKSHSVYIPHHAIWQHSDNGQKLRVVFDASRSTFRGESLNKLLYPGPPLQNNLLSVIIRWRRHKLVFCADIKMMYRQILVRAEDADLQRILWQRFGDSEPAHYRLLTLTYGMTCAPYLALRTLRQLAHDEGPHFPKAAHALLQDTYVDDVLSGGSNVEEAIELRNELVAMLRAGCFPLAKWSSNQPNLIEDIDPADRLRPEWHYFETGNPIRTLGISWDPAADRFRFRCPVIPVSGENTKRKVLATIARLFDPVGWLSPVTIIAKMLLQKVWKLRLHWDQDLPPPLASEWAHFLKDLPHVSRIQIPRWLGIEPAKELHLHGFADASKSAYAAAVYLVIPGTTGQAGVSRLITAKTKVAPVKTITIPRLELCAAVLLAKLLRYVIDVYTKASITSVHAWTDSTIVLAWLDSEPSRWEIFVANRVAEIQRTLPDVAWHHVRSSQNPADIASRGMPPVELETAHLWWNGPAWMHLPAAQWPSSSIPTESAAPIDSYQCFVTMLQPQSPVEDPFTRFSSLIRLERVIATCLRFRHCFSEREPPPRDRPFTFHELNTAFLRCVFWIQQSYFADDIRRLAARAEVGKNSALRKLTPFLDQQGILRVEGRLQGSELPYSERHPVILPKQCHLSRLVIEWAHHTCLHGGQLLTYAQVIKRAWIIGGRQKTKAIVRQCVRCAKSHARSSTQLMGNLPSERVTRARPFGRTGLDYAGPFQIKFSKGRGTRTSKGYLAIFVCLATKTVHMEIVGNLTTASFLAAVRRFSGRRGIPQELWSDNATTFHGADSALREMFRQASIQWPDVAEALASSRIQWKFIPPSAPHFGGLWEAAVKSAKSHLKRIIGTQSLTYEEFNTLAIQIESTLNSRPLTPVSGSPDDCNVLTPGHFLIGSSLQSIPEPIDPDSPIGHLKHWHLVQAMYHQFWLRWSREYLHTLQQRGKWTRRTVNLKENDLVLILDPSLLHRNRWPLGRVISVFPGSDGLVRAASVRTASGEYTRPITKLSILPVN